MRPKAPAAFEPSRASRSPTKPPRKPSGAPSGRQESAAPDVGARRSSPSVEKAVALKPSLPRGVHSQRPPGEREMSAARALRRRIQQAEA